MKKLQITFFALFFALLALVGALSLFGPQRAFSETENRTLKTRDSLKFTLASGRFAEDFERVLCEQFPGRDKTVSARSAALLLTGRTDQNGAYVGKGRLFQKITVPDLAAAQRESEKLKGLASSRPGLPVYVMPVPGAAAQLGDLLPKYAPVYDPAPVYDLFSAEGMRLIDLRETLTSPEDYFKTDHHWTLSGAYKAYAAFRAAKGESAPPLSAFAPETVSRSFYGTLSSKVPGARVPPDEVQTVAVPAGVTAVADGKEIPVYDLAALEGRDHYRVFFGGNYGILELTNPAAPGGTLLVLRDSFANCFAPFLLGDYSKIVLVDERYTAVSLPSLVDDWAADEVLMVREAGFGS